MVRGRDAAGAQKDARPRLRLDIRDPGLYERLFYDELGCVSPRVVRDLLSDVLEERAQQASELVVLDVGAGNGMVGEQLGELGAGSITGVDILEEAAAATERDRPGVYDDYRVVDLGDPPPADDAALAGAGFTCLMSVAALGFGDIPPVAFAQAFDYVADGGLVAFTLKERFTRPEADESGFGRLIRELHDHGRIEPLVEHRYRHRLSTAGDPPHYVAYIAEKRGDAAGVPSLAA
jgi:SAM-dependent methyltransferase